MSETLLINMRGMPGSLRNGDLVEDRRPDTGEPRHYVLTEPPSAGTITYEGQVIPVIYLAGMDTYSGTAVITVKVARLPIVASREYATLGRPAPVFLRPPEPTPLY